VEVPQELPAASLRQGGTVQRRLSITAKTAGEQLTIPAAIKLTILYPPYPYSLIF